ncbi:MAG: hypothetical protein KGL39_33710 [Patescibacteria group bacterium]|nr:hypothetical protein [Patescibacteria group bacterium]
MADDAQPQEGQGGAAPYTDYLERFPEEHRELAESVFKEWDGSVTKRFQEHADFRRQMEPFQQFQGRQADELKWGADFYDAASNNPQAVRDWYQEYAKTHGLEEALEPSADEGFEDPSLQALRQQLDPVAQQVQALTERFEQQDMQARLAEASQQIEAQMDTAKEKLGDLFNRDAIEGLVGKYIESDPTNAVERAAQDWERIANDQRAQALQGKVDTTSPAAETGGAADGSVPKISTFQQATEAVLARFAQNQQQ